MDSVGQLINSQKQSLAHGTKAKRLLSITFDDGFEVGAQRAGKILKQYNLNATFYVVTGWVEPMRARIGDSYNVNRSHGNWPFWRTIAGCGHEVGSHTFSHIRATGKSARLMPWRLSTELRMSKADLEREVPQSLYTVSMPWNLSSRVSKRIVSKLYGACRLGTTELCFNNLGSLNIHELKSWAPNSDVSAAGYRQAIDQIPDNGWLIIQLHSLDQEGWEPIREDVFEEVCKYAAGDGTIAVATVASIVKELPLL